MAYYKLTLMAVMAVLCSVYIQSGSATTCYSCGGDGTGKDTNGCGASPTNTMLQNTFPGNTTVADCFYCTTTINGIDSFSRSCDVSYSSAQTVGCRVISGSGLSAVTKCYCTGDKCNGKAVQYNRGSLSCYVCTSADFMDNGCGATLDSTSQYVRQVSGCTACSKDVEVSQGGGRYTRGCLYDTYSSNTCTGSLGCRSRCESNLCNTASPITTTRYPAILALGAALYAVYMS